MSAPRTVGPYSIVGPLGQGGMGLVYEARHPKLPRRLALKLLKRLTTASEKRFKREGELLARIKHPGVVAVHDLDRCPDSGYYLVTDLVEGRELAELCAEVGLDPDRAARILRDLADAVAAIHAQGVLHRDLKPQNVVLREDDTPVLLDFGLAWTDDAERLTRTGQFAGSPCYLAPEQARGKSGELDERSDVYSLGATLFHTLTGHPPFEGGSILELLRQVTHVDPQWPSDPGIPRALRAICERCLAKAPSDRYPSAADLRDDLSRYLARELTEADRRRRAKTAALVSLALATALLVAGLAVALPERPREPAVSVDPDASSPTKPDTPTDADRALDRSSAALDRGEPRAASAALSSPSVRAELKGNPRLTTLRQKVVERCSKLASDDLLGYRSEISSLIELLGVVESLIPDSASTDLPDLLLTEAMSADQSGLSHATVRLVEDLARARLRPSTFAANRTLVYYHRFSVISLGPPQDLYYPLFVAMVRLDVVLNGEYCGGGRTLEWAANSPVSEEPTKAYVQLWLRQELAGRSSSRNRPNQRQALRGIQRIISETPEALEPRTLANALLLLARYGDQEPTEKEAMLRQAMTLAPEDPALRLHLAKRRLWQAEGAGLDRGLLTPKAAELITEARTHAEAALRSVETMGYDDLGMTSHLAFNARSWVVRTASIAGDDARAEAVIADLPSRSGQAERYQVELDRLLLERQRSQSLRERLKRRGAGE